MIRFLVFLFAAGLMSGCCLIRSKTSDNASKENALCKPLYKPFVLEFYMGGGGGMSPCFKIYYQFGKIFYYKGNTLRLEDIDPIVINPTDEQWRNFIDKIYSIKACNWKKEYQPPYTIHDGTYWEIVIIFGGGNKLTDVVSMGNNAFPPDGFKELMQALDGLTGTTDLFYNYTSNPRGNDYIPRPQSYNDEDTPFFRPESE